MVAIGKLAFFLRVACNLSNFAFIIIYAPLSAIDCSMLISIPTSSREGFFKASIDVSN